MAKRRSTGFEAWLNAAQTPAYLLDKRRQITIFNRGCEDLTGWTAEDVVGELCDYTSPDDTEPIQRMLATLCPPPSVYEGELVEAPASVPTKTGEATNRLLHHFPLANRDGVIDRVLTFIFPVPSPTVSTRTSPAQRLHAELAALRSSLRERYGFSSIVAVSDAMHRVMLQVKLAADSTASIHLLGEPGTGREHLARVIHNEGELRPLSFVPLDCQRLSAVEILATLRRMFDKEPADTPKLPHLRTGSLFLRNVEHLPRDLQLVIVENWEPEDSQMPQRLITSSDRSIDVISEDEEMLPQFARLCGTLEVQPPPLRKRLDDVILLAQLFLENQNKGRQEQIEGFDEPTIIELKRYHWPGNTGELQQVVREAFEGCDGLLVEPRHLPHRFRSGMDARRTSPMPQPGNLELEPMLAKLEEDHIRHVLELANGNRAEAARLLGITRPKLYRRLEQLGIE